MNEPTMVDEGNPNVDAASFDQDAAASTDAEPGREAPLTSELRRLGERLAGAIRAAAGTPEAEALKGEVGDGMRKLRGELDGVLRRGRGDNVAEEAGAAESSSSAPASEGSEDADSGPTRAARVQDTVRNELASALRSLNGALDKLAGSLATRAEEGNSVAADDPADSATDSHQA